MNSQTKRKMGVGPERVLSTGSSDPMALGGMSPSQHLHVFTNAEALSTMYFWGFLWRFHHGRD